MGEEITISMSLFESIRKFVLEEDSFGNGRAKELKGFLNEAHNEYQRQQSVKEE